MRKVLVVVDMQEDFVRGSLGSEAACAIIPSLVNKIKSYPAADRFATRDTHFDDYLETMEGKKLPVKHCQKDTPGWQLIKEIRPLIAAKNIIDKGTFGSLELAKRLTAEDQHEPLAIELVGVCTDICVITNALLLKTYLPEREITVDKACCAGITQDKHQAALEVMTSCQINVQ